MMIDFLKRRGRGSAFLLWLMVLPAVVSAQDPGAGGVRSATGSPAVELSLELSRGLSVAAIEAGEDGALDSARWPSLEGDVGWATRSVGLSSEGFARLGRFRIHWLASTEAVEVILRWQRADWELKIRLRLEGLI